MAGLSGLPSMFHAASLFKASGEALVYEPTQGGVGDGREHSVVIYPGAGSCFGGNGAAAGRHGLAASQSAYAFSSTARETIGPRVQTLNADAGLVCAWRPEKRAEFPGRNSDALLNEVQDQRKQQQWQARPDLEQGRPGDRQHSSQTRKAKQSAIPSAFPKECTLTCKCHEREARTPDNMPIAHKVKYIGVRLRGRRRWVAEIKDNNHNVRKWLGTFGCPVQAAQAFDAAARAIRGPHTRANFKMGDPYYVASIADLPKEMLTEPLASLVPFAYSPPEPSVAPTTQTLSESVVGSDGSAGCGYPVHVPAVEEQSSLSPPADDMGNGDSPSSMCTVEKNSFVGQAGLHFPSKRMCRKDETSFHEHPGAIPGSYPSVGSCSSRFTSGCPLAACPFGSLEDPAFSAAGSCHPLANVPELVRQPSPPRHSAPPHLAPPSPVDADGLGFKAANSCGLTSFAASPLPLSLVQSRRALSSIAPSQQGECANLLKPSAASCCHVQLPPACTKASVEFLEGGTNLRSTAGEPASKWALVTKEGVEPIACRAALEHGDASKGVDLSLSGSSLAGKLLPSRSCMVVGPDMPCGRPAVPSVQDAGAPLLFSALWAKDEGGAVMASGRIRKVGDLGVVAPSLGTVSNGDGCLAKKQKLKESLPFQRSLQKPGSSVFGCGVVRSAIQDLPPHVVEAILDGPVASKPGKAWLSL